MGMNASAKLWYGAWTYAVPEAVRLELAEPASGDYEKVIDGVHIDCLFVHDRLVGVGGVIAHAYWAEDDKPVDLSDRPAVVEAAVDKFLDEYAVPGKRGVYLTADYT